VNGLPAVLAVPLIAAMQAGSLAAVFVAGGLAFAAGRRRLARELVVSGTLAWLAAKAARLMVHRGRPSALLAGVLIRGAKASGLGFASGHAAVAAALATAVAPYLGRRARRLVWCAVGIVGIARVYVGAHFPLDVVGGTALGWAIGSGVHLVWGAPGGRPGPRRGASEPAAGRHRG
jgi:membrane-associated phospholipid phosphatase